MAKTQKRSILVYFFSMSIVLMLIVLIFSSLSLQRLYKDYAQAKSNKDALVTCSAIFQTIRHYGFERGRVNVVMNFRGDPEKMQKSIDFLSKHGRDGDLAFAEVLRDTQPWLETDQPELAKKIAATLNRIKLLRDDYREQFQLPFQQRNLTLDDLWFNAMSEQIGHLKLILYSLMQKERWLPEQRPVAEAFFLLSQLRDHTGPVVSYLKASSFNISSLSSARMAEIKRRRAAVEVYLDRLGIVSNVNLGPARQDEIDDFKHQYLGRFYSVAESFMNEYDRTGIAPVLAKDYLPQGVKNLEKLNLISQALLEDFEVKSQKAIAEEKNKLWVGTLTSLTLLFLILFSLYLAYHNIYRRIMLSSGILEELTRGNLDIDIPEPKLNDEIDNIQTGLLRFRDNLIELNNSNHKLLAEMEQRQASEERQRGLSEERGLLLKEVNHRVKNNLALIIGMLNLEAKKRQDESYSLFIDEIKSRVNALSILHSLLSANQWQPIGLKDLCHQLVGNTLPRDIPPQIIINESDFVIEAAQAHNVSLVINELSTNTAKYAAENSQIVVTIHIEATADNGVHLSYQDNGPGYPQSVIDGSFPDSGIGMQMINGIVEMSLSGKFKISNHDGARSDIFFPILSVKEEPHEA
ncbi:Two-component sensor histidine kinase, contains HisKA and HATPase domains [Malonomonas rubra DSM 5091]|uniref:histidine kinase n=1 Tax=Malonomonas rubra DSM 5091 TaxID=1122189 RepID=A0A1M6KYQ1_MALRU|nr:sensor histidine kinase [Malonomonas rubra]SHJ64133.1 Two-component sensor histidine kinase, contains HisKA and HATPase domains [Malonomonas rubra DSM 5091]